MLSSLLHQLVTSPEYSDPVSSSSSPASPASSTKREFSLLQSEPARYFLPNNKIFFLIILKQVLTQAHLIMRITTRVILSKMKSNTFLAVVRIASIITSDPHEKRVVLSVNI